MARNKGTAFEKMIEDKNIQYRAEGRAVITKRPTPMVIIKRKPSGQFLASFDKKKSTVDFDGVYRGKSIQFEAKSVMEGEGTALRLRNIEEHQYNFLRECQLQGAICFIIVYFVKDEDIYILHFDLLERAFENALIQERESIPKSFFADYGMLVDSEMDYLSNVDRIIEYHELNQY